MNDSRGIDRDEANDIADHITAKSGWRRDEQDVVLADADVLEGQRLRGNGERKRFLKLTQRKKFIEYSGIFHQSQPGGGIRILGRDECLSGKVNFVEIHRRARDAFELILKRTDGNAVMNNAFQERPN